MRDQLKKPLLCFGAFFLCCAIVFAAVGEAINATMPPWRDSVGDVNHTEKITGQYLVELSAAQDDTLLIFGSSELRTTEISTHPVNFFSDKRAGFQVDIIGRGSCQSLIHAIQIAASGDALAGKKVVLITSPQSYVVQGITPDMFAANFSPQQYLELLQDDSLSADVKNYLSTRVAQLLDEYDQMPNAVPLNPAVAALARHINAPTATSSLENIVLSPYYALSRFLYNIEDKFSARTILAQSQNSALSGFPEDIDWEQEEQAALTQALSMTTNNDFGMLNDYYTTYIGTRLERQKNRDAQLSYSESKEYDDLRILFEICRQKNIEPLFVHVPLHGHWSDYTGFTAERREDYYDNVRLITDEFSVQTLDLTSYEYEEYFMCDVMHIGWKGWLEVDKAIVDYYYSR